MEKSTALTLEQSSSFNAVNTFLFLLSDSRCEYSEYLVHKTSVTYVKNVVKIVVYDTVVCGGKANSMQKKEKSLESSFVCSQFQHQHTSHGWNVLKSSAHAEVT